MLLDEEPARARTPAAAGTPASRPADPANPANPADPAQPARPVQADRGGGVAVWALLGGVWVVVAGQAIVRWVLAEDQFAPAPVLGPDAYPVWREVSLRVLEAASMAGCW